MRNSLALLAGIALILVAFYLAVQAPRESSPPEAIVAFQTALHATPLPPAGTPSPTPTSTPFTDTVSPFLVYGAPTPVPEAVLALLASTRYDGRLSIPHPERLTVLTQHPYYLGQEEIVVTGDRAFLTGTSGRLPASFGAVLLWDNGEYRIKFEHVETGRVDPQVSVSMDPQTGEIDFGFRDAGAGGRDAAAWQSYPVECFVDSCTLIQRAHGFGVAPKR